MTDLQRIKEVIVLTALYYGRNDLNQAVVAMMADDLKSYGAEAVCATYESYRKNGKNRAFPLPAQILELLEGGNSRTNAAAIVINLIAAVKRHDYTWPMQLNHSAYQTGTFEGDFRAELGDAAWDVVRMHGGWANFCDSYWKSAGNETGFKAQIRDVLEGIVEKRRSGDLLQFSPRLKLEDQPKEIQEIIKVITQKDGA
jgi:hypothetical protein